MKREFIDEYDYLIHLVKCAIHDVIPCEIPQNLSFQKVFQYGVKHEIANIAFYSVEKLRNKPASELYDKWAVVRDQAIVRDMTQGFAREEIIEAFQTEGIRYLEVQGTKTKKMYPKAEYRTMSDIDFIIDAENLQKGKSILRTLGYRCMDHGCEIDGYREPNIFVELHSEFFPEQSPYHLYLNGPFERVITVEDSLEVDDNSFYLYSVMHVIKHYYNWGCGIRRVLDLYLLNQYYAVKIDCDYVSGILQESQIADLARLFERLAEYWFGNGDYDEELSELIDYVKTAGVHGTPERGIGNRVRKEMQQRKKGVGGKLCYLFKRIFPGTEIMYQYFPFLKKCIILMPICWILRWMDRIIKNGKNVIVELREIGKYK